MKLLDRFLRRPFYVQLLSLLGIIFIVTLVGKIGLPLLEPILETNQLSEAPQSESTDLKGDTFRKENPGLWVFTRMLEGSYIEDADTGVERWIAFSISIIGLLLLAGILLTMLVNAYENRMVAAREGSVRYRFDEHCVILGWDQFGVSLIKYYWKDVCKEGKDARDIVIFCHRDVVSLKREVFSNIKDKKLESRIYLLAGEITSREGLESVYIHNASDVFVLGLDQEPSFDSYTLSSAYLIAQIAEEKRSEKRVPLDCSVHIRSSRSFRKFQSLDIALKSKEKIQFRVFNNHANWARRVLNSFPLENNHRLGVRVKEVVFVIIGFGDMGNALAISAILEAHRPSIETTKLLIVDQNAKELKTIWESEYPNVKAIERIELEFMECKPTEHTFRERLLRLASDDSIALTTAVCFTNPDLSLNTALELPDELRKCGRKIFARQFSLEGAPNLIIEARETGENQKFRNLYFFGAENDICEIFRTQEQLARSAHDSFLAQAEQDGSYHPNQPNMRPWNLLSEQFRWSNRNQVDHFNVKARALDCVVIPKADLRDGQTAYVPSKEELEMLASMEHARFCAERYLMGWKQGPVKDPLDMISPYLVSYDSLEEKIKDYDRNAVNQMLELLEQNDRCFVKDEMCLAARKLHQKIGLAAGNGEDTDGRGECVDVGAVQCINFCESSKVLIVAGDMELSEDTSLKLQTFFASYLKDFEGSIISGGSNHGICKVIGDVVSGLVGDREDHSHSHPDARIRLLAYFRTFDAKDDPIQLHPAYDPVTKIGKDFSQIQPLKYWYDLLESKVHPRDIELIGYGGGELSEIEYELALDLGAKVSLFKDSGRAADRVLRRSKDVTAIA